MLACFRDRHTRARVVAIFLLVLIASASLLAQGRSQPTTRTEQLEAIRRDKIATLWPETQSPLVEQVNTVVERGLREGVETGTGSNGFQVLLGGMRSGHGQTFGLGYRRADFWHDRIAWRGTVRATLKKAVLVDGELSFPKLRNDRGGFVNVYAKYEHSPRMDYYGPGQSSSRNDRTSYRFEDYNLDAQAGFQPVRNLNIGLTGGFISVETGRGRRPGVLSTDELFAPPGFGVDTYFRRGGFLVNYDYRDRTAGAQKGGNYVARIRYYSDRQSRRFSFREEEYIVDHYIPYFNRTRVVALRFRAHLTFAKDGRQVPFYLQPTLGGNDDLRGFSQYRFHDNNYIYASAEHRWFVFEGLDMAAFIDTGKVVAERRDIDFTDLSVSAGLGFRWKLQGTVFMRMDVAAGREGVRFIWTFSDIYRFRWINR